MIIKIKYFIAIALIPFIFAPIASCGKKITVDEEYYSLDGTQRPNTVSKLNPKQKIENDEDYWIPIKLFKIKEPGTWIFVCIFIWQLPLLLMKDKILKVSWKIIIAKISEFIFSLFSIFYIAMFYFDESFTLTKWGYLALVLMIFFLLICIFEILKEKNITSNLT